VNLPFAGNIQLSAEELRVLGCLLEKQRTTPDVYPLSLNALRLACNQSTNRDPVVEYDESTIRDALQRLERRGLVRMASGAGSRASKYRHLLAERLPMDDAEQAIVCVLALRGAQTPGELKQRSERMHPFAGLPEVHDALGRLIERGLVERLERRPGQKEERYRHLLELESDGDGDSSVAIAAPRATGAATVPDELATPGSGVAAGEDGMRSLIARVERLEREVAELRRAVPAGAGEGLV
jgi:uncharacterized protein YceH (UPF0502 family)